jgi:hypothetical protein
MPTNLPPEYFAVDKRYRAATTTEEKIETLEELRRCGTSRRRWTGQLGQIFTCRRADERAARGSRISLLNLESHPGYDDDRKRPGPVD